MNTGIFWNRRDLKRCLAVAALIAALAANGCAPAARPAAAPSAVPATATAAMDQTAFWEAWQKGPHASTYDQGKGPNTYCARCHAPLNWDPAAKVDQPPNCVSCKFATDPQMRIAAGNPPVSKEAWKSIGCEICHQMKSGAAVETPAWLNLRTGYHESVANSTELCSKCHTDTQAIRHARDLGTQAHKNFTCTDCHDAHSAAASCTAAGCHAPVPNATAGHDSAHAGVQCVACHDAAKLEVGPVPDKGVWLTFRTSELLGRKTNAPYQSHNVQRAAECARCHFAGNPWKLSVQSGKAP